MILDTLTGDAIRLSDVASVRLQPSPNSIDRGDGSRPLDILADAQGRDICSLGAAVAAALAAHDFPRGYQVELLGEYEEQQAAEQRLLITG